MPARLHRRAGEEATSFEACRTQRVRTTAAKAGLLAAIVTAYLLRGGQRGPAAAVAVAAAAALAMACRTTTREAVRLMPVGVLVERAWAFGARTSRVFLEADAVAKVLILEQVTTVEVRPYIAFQCRGGDGITAVFTEVNASLECLEACYQEAVGMLEEEGSGE